MKRIAMMVTVYCVLQAGIGQAVEKDAGKRSLAATEKYYSELLAGPTPNSAELNLLMGMLPKGADLHHHYSGAIYTETYLDWVDKQNFCIYHETNAELKAEIYRVETSQSLPDAARKICISADAARRDNGFYRELLKRWSDKDYTGYKASDQQFFDTFGYFSPVSGYNYNEGLKSLKARAKAENVQYIETMLKGAPDVDNQALAQAINALTERSGETEIIKALSDYADFMARDPGTQQKIEAYVKGLGSSVSGIDDQDFTLRFQSYVSRNNSPAQIFSGLYSSFASAKKSRLIVGVNFVGPENGYVAMKDYKLHMRMFRFLNQRFPGVKLSLHAGELTLGMVPPEGLKDHIHDAVTIAGARRIGHGIDITYEAEAPALLQNLKKRNIAIEVNLTSNEFILGVKNEAHPVTVYRRHGVPFVLSTDDAGVSRNNLTGEYLLFVSRYKPTYRELKEVALNSIRYSFLNDDEKKIELERLMRRFAAFEKAVEKLAQSTGRK